MNKALNEIQELWDNGHAEALTQFGMLCAENAVDGINEAAFTALASERPLALLRRCQRFTWFPQSGGNTSPTKIEPAKALSFVLPFFPFVSQL